MNGSVRRKRELRVAEEVGLGEGEGGDERRRGDGKLLRRRRNGVGGGRMELWV